MRLVYHLEEPPRTPERWASFWRAVRTGLFFFVVVSAVLYVGGMMTSDTSRGKEPASETVRALAAHLCGQRAFTLEDARATLLLPQVLEPLGLVEVAQPRRVPMLLVDEQVGIQVLLRELPSQGLHLEAKPLREFSRIRWFSGGGSWVVMLDVSESCQRNKLLPNSGPDTETAVAVEVLPPPRAVATARPDTEAHVIRKPQ